MYRHRNTDVNGNPFAPAVVQAVWDKTESNPEHAPLKMDAFGNLIWRQAFGNTSSKLGWEIHHRLPVEQGGGDDLDNLEAVQWDNHRRVEAEVARSTLPGPDTEDPPPAARVINNELIKPVAVA